MLILAGLLPQSPGSSGLGWPYTHLTIDLLVARVMMCLHSPAGWYGLAHREPGRFQCKSESVPGLLRASNRHDLTPVTLLLPKQGLKPQRLHLFMAGSSYHTAKGTDIREMHIKAIMRCCLTPTRMGTIKDTGNESTGECVEKLELWSSSGGKVNDVATLESNVSSP